MCKVKTSEEVIEIAGAYFQYYRETGVYLERTSVWVERLGLDTIRAVIEDKKQRQELNQRLDEVISIQEEPWSRILKDERILTELYKKVTVPVTTN